MFSESFERDVVDALARLETKMDDLPKRVAELETWQAVMAHQHKVCPVYAVKSDVDGIKVQIKMGKALLGVLLALVSKNVYDVVKGLFS